MQLFFVRSEMLNVTMLHCYKVTLEGGNFTPQLGKFYCPVRERKNL